MVSTMLVCYIYVYAYPMVCCGVLLHEMWDCSTPTQLHIYSYHIQVCCVYCVAYCGLFPGSSPCQQAVPLNLYRMPPACGLLALHAGCAMLLAMGTHG